VTGSATPCRRTSRVRFAVGLFLGFVVWMWSRTWRIQLRVPPGLVLSQPGSIVFAFWHGQQMPLAALRRRGKTAALVSLSGDGAIQNGVLRLLGLQVVHGSTTRGGAQGLRGMIAALQSGTDAAFAVDGPRGPLRRAKCGAAHAAWRSGARLVPVGAAALPCCILSRSWDKFEVPLPFARVQICLGLPVDPLSAARCPELLASRISAAAASAQRRLCRGVSSSLRVDT
jgi:lysophospholipid acyltransferase (LPLAT)-like uncharacterized protein